MTLGPRQLALIAAVAGDMIDPPSTIQELFGPRGKLKGAKAYSRKGSVTVSRGVIERLRKRGLYQAGKITQAAIDELAAFRARGGTRA